MSWEQTMLEALSHQSDSMTGLQISQSDSASLMSSQLQEIYKSQETSQQEYLQLLQALNKFSSVMGQSDLHSYLENYDGADSTQDGAQDFYNDFMNEFSQYGITIEDTSSPDFSSSLKSKYDSGSDWQITFTLDGIQQTISGSDTSDLSNAISEIQDAQQGANTTSNNAIQESQATESDVASGFQSTSQAASNLLSIGNNLAQALGFTSSLLASMV